MNDLDDCLLEDPRKNDHHLTSHGDRNAEKNEERVLSTRHSFSQRMQSNINKQYYLLNDLLSEFIRKLDNVERAVPREQKEEEILFYANLWKTSH